MKRVFFCLYFFISNACFAQNCAKDLYNIILTGDIDCLEVFLRDYVKEDKDILNKPFARPDCEGCDAFDSQNYGLSSVVGENDTPLTLAAKWHDLPMMKMLIDAGADINSRDPQGNTALMISVSNVYSYYVSDMDLAFAKAFGGVLDTLSKNLRYKVSGKSSLLGEDPVSRLQQAGRTDIDLENYLTYQTLYTGGSVYNDAVDYLLDAGADVNLLNNYNENALYISVSTASMKLSQDVMDKLISKTELNDLVPESGYTITAKAYCTGGSEDYSVHMLIDRGYDKNKIGTNGKSLCDLVNWPDFVSYGCQEFDCNAEAKGKILPCQIPNGYFDWDECVDKHYGTKICDGRNWSKCSFERGDNKCMHGYSMVGFCQDGKCCGSLDKEEQTKINELADNAAAMKEKEQSTENKLLGGATMAATGIGGMKLASGLAEQSADADAETAMRAYLETFYCKVGTNGSSIKGGTMSVIVPGGNELINLYSEYVNLANDLKARKSALGMKSGIESEAILDGATSGLYDEVYVGKTGGVYTSLARALQNPNGDDAKKWAEQKRSSSDDVKAGAIVGGVGAVGGAVGNLIINNGVDYTKTGMGKKKK